MNEEKRVLIINEEPEALNSLKKILVYAGYTVELIVRGRTDSLTSLYQRIVNACPNLLLAQLAECGIQDGLDTDYYESERETIRKLREKGIIVSVGNYFFPGSESKDQLIKHIERLMKKNGS